MSNTIYRHQTVHYSYVEFHSHGLSRVRVARNSNQCCVLYPITYKYICIDTEHIVCWKSLNKSTQHCVPNILLIRYGYVTYQKAQIHPNTKNIPIHTPKYMYQLHEIVYDTAFNSSRSHTNSVDLPWPRSFLHAVSTSLLYRYTIDYLVKRKTTSKPFVPAKCSSDDAVPLCLSTYVLVYVAPGLYY